MFSIVSIAGFIVAFVGIGLHCILFRPKLDDLFSKEQRMRLLEQKLNFIGILRKLVYLLALLCFAVLAITGFFPQVVLGKPISGYWLMLHATAAPVFAGCLAVLAVMWAHNCRFDKNYWPWLQKILPPFLLSQESRGVNQSTGQKFELVQKTVFWLIIVLALPLILSIVSTMLLNLGTQWQHFLLNTHRYTALLFALVALVHMYLMVLSKARQ